MNQLQTKLIDTYNKYLEFDNVVKKKNEGLKDKNNLLTTLSDDEVVAVKNKYKDSIIMNSQLRMSFEQLMYLISVCFEVGVEIPEDIKKYYDESLPYKAKAVFAVEKEELIPIDSEMLEKHRKELDNHPLLAMINNSAPN